MELGLVLHITELHWFCLRVRGKKPPFVSNPEICWDLIGKR